MATPNRPRTQRYKHEFAGKPRRVTTVAGDGAIAVTEDSLTLLTKGSAAAITVAAPGAANIGRQLEIMGGSDFAHVVTFTGSTLYDGTSGGHLLCTTAAFQGSSVKVRAISATKWYVLVNNLCVITTS